MFKMFVDEIDGDSTWLPELSKAVRTTEQSCQLQPKRLNNTKFRQILGYESLGCKFYEAKTKNGMRIYMFQHQKRRVVVTGGIKGDQPKDIKHVAGIIEQFLKQ